MKVAWCLFGQPRLYKKGYEIISNFINFNKDCTFDFFYHTWFDQSLAGTYYNCSTWRYIPIEDLLIENNLIENINNLYNPVSYMFEQPKVFDNEKYLKYHMLSSGKPEFIQNINNTISNVYSKYKSFEVLENHIEKTKEKYDIVISSRFDLLINFSLDLKTLDLNKIHTMVGGPNRLYISDHFVLSNFDMMKKYSSAYENLELFLSKTEYINYLNKIGAGPNFAVENIMTGNLLNYYDDLYSIIYLDPQIPNFVN